MAEFGITLEDAVSELQYEVEEARNFMEAEFMDQWGRAERYYAGECDVPTEEGRSNAVKTVVRDIIRSAMPSIMRVLYQGRKPVEFIPHNPVNAAFVEQQALFAFQQFNACGGYKLLLSAVQQAAKLKIGPIKTFWEPNPTPKYFKATALSEEEVEILKEAADIEVNSVEEHESDTGFDGFYDVEGYQYKHNGQICLESFPVYEFFVSRDANDLEHARVHGHCREMTVAEAMALGVEYDNWEELTGTDPEDKSANEMSRARRGYSPNGGEEEDSDDITQKKILLTEVYCKYDLNGDGVEERYCFILGGTNYKYVTHYEIEDYCIDLVCVDPVHDTVIGRSLADLTFERQDNETSLLRAIIDNAHMANNPRIAGDPTTTDFADLMNNATGAPIKTEGTPALQVIDIPFTGQGLIPFLEYMDQDTQESVGVTKAAAGLEPDALQSTDKDAVRNTIAMSQGQIELMVRNVIETALVNVFRRVLRLSIRHMDRVQLIRTKGVLVPIDIATFDPDLAAEPAVGLGTASAQERLQALQFILQKQEEIFATFGLDNPFVSLSQRFNTLEDIIEVSGMHDPGRYFTIVTPQMEQQIAAAMAQQAEEEAAMMQEQQPIDPARALIDSENIKARVKTLEIMQRSHHDNASLQFEAEKALADQDFKRDELVQERVIELRKIGAEALNDRIKQEQESNSPKKGESAGKKVTGNENRPRAQNTPRSRQTGTS